MVLFGEDGRNSSGSDMCSGWSCCSIALRVATAAVLVDDELLRCFFAMVIMLLFRSVYCRPSMELWNDGSGTKMNNSIVIDAWCHCIGSALGSAFALRTFHFSSPLPTVQCSVHHVIAMTSLYYR